MEEDSLLFVKKNIEIFGFENEEEALMTTFVELLDNSIDSLLCNHNIPGSEKIINVQLKEQDEESYQLSIIDNGVGMASNDIPYLCGGLFHTNKHNTSEQTVGKFGVGLKAIMIHYNSILTVSSSVLSETEVTSYKVCFKLRSYL